MKRLTFFLCIIISFSEGPVLAQKHDAKTDKQKSEQKSDCDRIKLTIDQFSGTKTYSTPTNNMKPFNSIWIPQLRIYKIIPTTGEVGYFLSFSIPGNAYIEGKDYNYKCIVLFEDGKRIEKPTEVTVTKYTGHYTSFYYHTDLPLDSTDIQLLRNNKMKAIRLIEYDLEKISTPEFYEFYLNCLVDKN